MPTLFPVNCTKSSRGLGSKRVTRKRLTQSMLPEAVVIRLSAANVGKQRSWNSDLSYLKRDIAAVAHDFSADLDQLFLRARQRPVFVSRANVPLCAARPDVACTAG